MGLHLLGFHEWDSPPLSGTKDRREEEGMGGKTKRERKIYIHSWEQRQGWYKFEADRPDLHTKQQENKTTGGGVCVRYVFP